MPARQRVVIRELPLGFSRVSGRAMGSSRRPSVPSLSPDLREEGLEIDADSALFFLTREIPIATELGMAKAAGPPVSLLARNQRRASTFFHLPHERVIELGVEVEL